MATSVLECCGEGVANDVVLEADIALEDFFD